MVEDYGNGLSEIGTIGGLGDVIGQAILPPISHELAADAAAHRFTVTPRFLPSDPMVVITPSTFETARRGPPNSPGGKPGSGRSRPSSRPSRRPSRARTASSRCGRCRPSRSRSRPHAEPRGGGRGDVATFADRLGLTPALVGDLASGRPLHSTSTGSARSARPFGARPTTYGARTWPADPARLRARTMAEPHRALADGRGTPATPRRVPPPPTRRRSRGPSPTEPARPVVGGRRASAPAEPVPDDPDEATKVVAVCYRHVGTLAELPDGETREVDPDTDADQPSVEAYHLSSAK